MSNVLLAAWFIVTSYCCPPHCGITKSGEPVAPGAVAAPRSIPFGTLVEMDGYAGRVVDRGGAIAEGRLDVWFSDCDQARQWGIRRRFVTVTWPDAPAGE